MSLLLEALKKAALEKQSRADEDQSAPVPAARPALGDTLDQNNEVEPVPNPEPESQTSQTLIDIDEELIEEAIEEGEIDSESANEELVFEPEFEEAEVADSTGAVEREELVENLDFATTDHEIELEAIAPDNEQALDSDDLIDHEEIEAARFKLEQEQALEEQRLLMEQERLRKEEEEQQAEEQERQRQEELEQKRKADAAKEEQARQIAINREALDQLITSGKNIEQKAKRRSAFLYLLLLFTAVGGLSAYYVFLIANTGKNELRTTTERDTNPDVVEVAELLQTESLTPSDDTQIQASESLLAQATLSDPDTNVQDGSNASSEPYEDLETQTGQPASTANQTLTGGTGALSTGAALDSETTSRSAASERTTLSIATRVDPAPSASAYLQPLILSATGQVQESLAERVIIHHKAKPATINELVTDAYNRLQAGDVAQADQFYRQALAESPNQRDALLGLAATAAALGQYDEAISLYQRRLVADPDDTYAQAGMFGLVRDAASRSNVTQEIERLLTEFPESAQLHFAKGIGLTQKQDWQNAQTSFYDAYRLDSGNPDFAFNLAISLDHLNQPSLARVYYERALTLSNTRTSNFDRSAATQRVAEISNDE